MIVVLVTVMDFVGDHDERVEVFVLLFEYINGGWTTTDLQFHLHKINMRYRYRIIPQSASSPFEFKPALNLKSRKQFDKNYNSLHSYLLTTLDVPYFVWYFIWLIFYFVVFYFVISSSSHDSIKEKFRLVSI